MRLVRSLTYWISIPLLAIVVAYIVFATSQGMSLRDCSTPVTIGVYFLAAILLSHFTTGRKCEKWTAWIALMIAVFPFVMLLYLVFFLRGWGC